jgi:SAM-dependent methyltransferase
MQTEAQKVQERYARRLKLTSDDRYSALNPAVWRGLQERQRGLISLLQQHARTSLNQLKVLEIGCGGGGNLLEMLRMGFSPENLIGNELLSERANLARKNLPIACEVIEADATTLDIKSNSLDIVYQSTVFSSLLDDAFQHELANLMWSWIKPGGGILWYDFIYNNPNNKDVRGVTLNRIRALFPEGKLDFKRVTLAPPISRRVCKIYPPLYSVFNAIPALRTHVICWIEKKE